MHGPASSPPILEAPCWVVRQIVGASGGGCPRRPPRCPRGIFQYSGALRLAHCVFEKSPGPNRRQGVTAGKRARDMGVRSYHWCAGAGVEESFRASSPGALGVACGPARALARADVCSMTSPTARSGTFQPRLHRRLFGPMRTKPPSRPWCSLDVPRWGGSPTASAFWMGEGCWRRLTENSFRRRPRASRLSEPRRPRVSERRGTAAAAGGIVRLVRASAGGGE